MKQSQLWTKHITDIFSEIPSSYSYVTLLNFIFSTITKYKDFLTKFQRLCFMLSNVGCYKLIVLEIHYFFIFSFKQKENESKHPFLLFRVKWIYHVPSSNPSWKTLGNIFRVSLCISEFDIEHLQIITFAWLVQWGSTVDLHSFNTEMERWGNIFIKAFLLHLFLFDAEAICFLSSEMEPCCTVETLSEQECERSTGTQLARVDWHYSLLPPFAFQGPLSFPTFLWGWRIYRLYCACAFLNIIVRWFLQWLPVMSCVLT